MHRGPSKPVRGQNASMGPTASVSFSNDTLNWGPEIYTTNDVVVGTGHGKPGLVSIPGGIVTTQIIMQPNKESRTPSDVVGSGMGLLASKDGINYKLLRKLWPYEGGYTTIAPFDVDASGAALTYGIVFEAGDASLGRFAQIVFQNFSSSPGDLENVAEEHGQSNVFV